MSCGCGGAFFRQLDTVVVTLDNTDLTVVPIVPPMIAWSWWQVGKRLIFEVPCTGVLYSDTVFEINLRDQTAMENHIVGGLGVLAGSEIESFRLVCDVVLIANSIVTLKSWVDYPFPIGTPGTVFLNNAIDTAFHPLLPQILVQQSAVVDSEITLQNVQFSGFAKTSPLIC